MYGLINVLNYLNIKVLFFCYANVYLVTWLSNMNFCQVMGLCDVCSTIRRSCVRFKNGPIQCVCLSNVNFCQVIGLCDVVSAIKHSLCSFQEWSHSLRLVSIYLEISFATLFVSSDILFKFIIANHE